MEHPFLRKINFAVIDVSLYQGKIDWDAVRAAGVQGAVVKATQELYVDPKFKVNQAGARRTMRRVGYYHFYKSYIDPVAQARFFVKTIGPLTENEFVVFDGEEREVAPAAYVAGVQLWLNEVERLTGKIPWIYASPSFVKLYGFDKHFVRYPYWPAHWGVSAPKLLGWRHWVLWQTGVGKVAGISGDVDVNRAPPSFLGVSPLRAAAFLVLGAGAGKFLLDKVG